jgi:TolA-binding protein
MMKKTIFGPIMCLFLLGCATSQHASRPTSKETDLDRRALAYKSRMEKDQDTRDRQRFLAAKKRYSPNQVSALSPSTILNRSFAQKELKRSDLENASEGALYANALDRYQSGNSKSFYPTASVFLRKFAKSDRSDDVYYMLALTELADKNYGGSLVHLNRILHDHPQGRKAPAALFAKGMVFKRMNLEDAARGSLTAVLKKYPGSPESVRASAEMKLLR